MFYIIRDENKNKIFSDNNFNRLNNFMQYNGIDYIIKEIVKINYDDTIIEFKNGYSLCMLEFDYS